MKYLIFDFDGVLGDTWDARVEILAKMDNKSKEEVIVSGDKYFMQSNHTRDSGISQEALLAMRERRILFGNLLHEKGFNLFEGFIDELKKISDAKMAIVSSGSNTYVKPKAENCGLAFTHVLAFEDHHSKEEKVEKVCKDWGISVKDAYFFTDTVSDVRELENIMDKNKIYGCSWGWQGHQKLATVLDKKHIFDNFSDIQRVFKK